MKRRSFIFYFAAPVALAGALPRMSITQTRQYLREDQALRLVFPRVQSIRAEEHTLTGQQRAGVEHQLRYRLAQDRYRVYLGESNGVVEGYALILNEIGKEEFITFIVSVTPQFRVHRVALMVFRESRGWEVEDPRFTNQFRGKSANDPLQVNVDIVGVTGATLSCRALCKGTKKAVALCEAFYRR
jgi:FAD:protein FMN transferase